jgi:hypothetical protein
MMANKTGRVIETDDTDTAPGDANRDPISGAPGAHPIGVGMGATGGAVAGAAAGALAGPVGAAVGAAAGAIAGGLAGKAAAEGVNPTVEDAYWRTHYTDQPYVESGTSYDVYRPAYRYGWESYSRHRGRSFDEAEPDLRRGWDQFEGSKNLSWDSAKKATRDAWHRVERALPGDADNDGR